tara:strand:+ start:2277 stop:3398 length:1122 start_codon:yes stop_codon:yes gene_type:complete
MGEKKQKGFTVIMKPTHSCNLACKYCYIEDGAEQGIMDKTTLKNSIEKIVHFNGGEKGTHFIWHGGEPILMGVEFFENILSIQKNLGRKYKVSNGIQTNGTLLNSDLLDFIEKNRDFYLGLSLDGPRELHNQTRVYKGGKGSFDDVMRGIDLIKGRTRIGGGVIAVITQINIDHFLELYSFFKDNDINFKANPLIRSGEANKNYNQIAISPKQYGDFLINLFDIWFYDSEGDKISVDPLEKIAGNLITGSPVGCNYSESCQNNFISIGPLGDVYPCGRFDGVQEFRYGNINHDSVENLLNVSSRKLLLQRSVETIEGCRPCEYKEICNAGCIHNAYMVNGQVNEKDYYCTSYKMIFNHIKEAIKKEINLVEVK